jgi:2-haloacid dehalogenase
MAMTRPAVVVFDVNETLSDMSPMGQRFADLGAPPHLARLWFAQVLRDGFALTCAGATETFATLGREALRQVLERVPLDRDLDDATEHVMAGFTSLDPHPDVAPGVRALREAGLRLVTLSNGAASVAHGLLERAGLRTDFEALLSVEDAGVWKPAPGAYRYAARACGTQPHDLLLVAVHPWDIDGAARAGLATAWISRSGGSYPGCFTPPDATVASLTELAAQLKP